MKKLIVIVLTLIMLMSVTLVVAGNPTDMKTNHKKVIIGFVDKPNQADENMIRGLGGKTKYTYHIINAKAVEIPEQAIDYIKKNPRVAYVEEDAEVHALDAELDNSWGVKQIGAGVVHEYNKGTGVKVAIIDTGIDYDHPDLDGNYKGGYDFVNGDSDPMDDNGHGTHCAGIVAAEDNDIRVIGVAPEAYLYGVKVLNSGGSGLWSDVIAGIEWSVDNDMQIISMSLGDGDLESVEAACDAAYAAGIVVVAAAGNSGNPAGRGDNVGYPAAYSSVIAVAATDSQDERARWSSTGPDVELAAPGVSIYSTILNDNYGYKSGTSMACPHVTGTAALVKEAYPEWTNVQIREQLQITADDLGASGLDNLYGWGLVDADEAALPTDTTAPAKVTGLTIIPVSCIQLDLSWDANTETDLDHYNVYRSTTSGGTYDLIASPTTNSSSDTGLTALTTYYYNVSAVDTSGNVGEASDVESKTTNADNLGPVTSNVVADPNPTSGDTSVTLTADINDSTTGNSNIVAAEYFVGILGTGTSMDGTFDSPTEAVTATIDVSGWAVGQYTLYVHGKDTAGNWGATESVVLDVTEEPTNIMYVESIDFSSKVAGPNKFLYTTVKVVDGSNPLEGVGVEMTLDLDQENDGTIDGSWNFAGDTGTDGTVKFTLSKAPSGDYTANVTNLTFTDYIWLDTMGETSASCELQNDGTVIQ